MKLTKQEYLYGKNIIVPKVPPEVANERIRLLNKNLHELLEEGYIKRDNIRVTKVMEAIEFWTDLREGKDCKG